MSEQTAAPDLDQIARDVLDSVRYVVLGTIDDDGRTRTSPVYFTPHRYEDLYWVSNRGTHHSHNLHRDPRLSGVVFDSTRWELGRTAGCQWTLGRDGVRDQPGRSRPGQGSGVRVPQLHGLDPFDPRLVPSIADGPPHVAGCLT